MTNEILPVKSEDDSIKMLAEKHIYLRWILPDGSTTSRWEAAIPEGASEHERKRIINMAAYIAKHEKKGSISILEELGKNSTIK